MNTEILNAATLYVTDRSSFDEQHGESLHRAYLDMLFLGATTRPDLAETVPVTLCGWQPKAHKHGPDGLPNPGAGRENHCECKVSTTDTSRKARGGIGNVTINDPSQSIVDEYEKLDATFLFPLFIDGHLITILSVEWEHLRQVYADELTKLHKKNLDKKPGASAPRNFSLTTSRWIENASIEYVHKDVDLALRLMKAVKVTKKYIRKIEAHLLENGKLTVDHIAS